MGFGCGGSNFNISLTFFNKSFEMPGTKTRRFVEILDTQKKNDEMCTLDRIVAICLHHLV